MEDLFFVNNANHSILVTKGNSYLTGLWPARSPTICGPLVRTKLSVGRKFTEIWTTYGHILTLTREQLSTEFFRVLSLSLTYHRLKKVNFKFFTLQIFTFIFSSNRAIWSPNDNANIGCGSSNEYENF